MLFQAAPVAEKEEEEVPAPEPYKPSGTGLFGFLPKVSSCGVLRMGGLGRDSGRI
jgi:hypothetical protein